MEEFIELSSLREGRQYELGCLGYCPQDGYIPEYMPYTASMWWTVYHQPEDYDPRHPTRGLNEELFYLVQRMLPKRWRHLLRWFIAVGTSFDQWHGIDAFFYLGGTCVTVDVTTYQEKSYKADFLVTPRELDPGRLFVSAVLAKNIANLLIKRRSSEV